MRSILLLAPWLCFCIPATAQSSCTSSLTGIIVDEQDRPLSGAAIMITPRQLGQLSDAEGKFQFSGLCPGDYTVKVQFLGYEDLSMTLRISGSVNREIHLKELATELEEVVIHHDAEHTETATNIAELDERKLSENAGKSLGEVMRDVTGVNSIQSGPGIFKPVIHGVHSQRILILNHGIRQEGQQWGAEHAPEIDPFVASNVVVVKDASAIKYGSDALGGTIIVNPAELPESGGITGALHTVLQSNGRSGTISGTLEGGIGEKTGWGWRLQGTAKGAGDYHAPNYSLTNTGVREFNFSMATGYHEEKRGFDVFFSRFQSELGILKGTAIGNLDDLANAMGREEPLYTTDFSYDIGAPRQTVNHSLLKINGHHQTDRGEWRVQYGLQQNNRKEYDLRMGDLENTPAMNLKLTTQTLDAEWETLHTGRASHTFGVNLMTQDNQNVPGTQRIPFIPNFFTFNTGAFGFSKISLHTWTIDVGARYDFRYYDVKGYDFKNTYYATSFQFNNASATVGATHQITDKQSLRISVSSAWRPPHVAELFSLGTHQSAAAIEYGLLLNDSTNEVMNFDDVNFRTEQAVKSVITYQLDWRKWSIQVSPFINYIFNYTYLRPTGITQNSRGTYPYFRYTQTDALFTGADASIVLQASHHWKIAGSSSLLLASDVRNNDYLVYVPSNRYDLTVRYEKPVLAFGKNFYAETKFRYVAKQTRSPRVVTIEEIKDAIESGSNPFAGDPSNFDYMAAPDGYLLWNAAVGWTLGGKRTQYDFRLASENMLNTSYREYTNRFRYYADDMGRNIILSVKCIF
ncbi:TonB-dependent receptor [Chryseolinea sp. T2]|uniref:TonB-dependent receptor n=1 Tax=Chryseolinea sp. T2 TaxID=3129255 RepID=UPI0030772F35